MVYLLAFDRTRVENALREEAGEDRGYLEKIVQVLHDVPVVPQQALRAAFFEALDQELRNSSAAGRFNFDRWPDVYVEVVEPLLRNLRDVKRLVASAFATLKSIDGRVDTVDVLGLETIRVFLPRTFSLLRASATALTSPPLGRSHSQESSDLKMVMQRLLDSDTAHRDIISALCSRLFPFSARHLDGTTFDSSYSDGWLKERRVAVREILDTYLWHDAADGLVTMERAETVFELLTSGAAALSYLDALEPEDVEATIAGLESFENDFPKESITNGLTAVFSQAQRLTRRSRGFVDFGPDIVVTRVGLRMLRRVEDEAERETIVEAVLSALASFHGQFLLILMVGHLEGAGHKLVSEDRADRYQAEFARSVFDAGPDKLTREPRLVRLLYYAKKFSATSWTIPDGWLGGVDFRRALLRHAVSEVRSQQMGSRAVNVEQTLDWDSLVILFGTPERVRTWLANRPAGDPEPQEYTELRVLAARYADGWRPPGIGRSEDG